MLKMPKDHAKILFPAYVSSAEITGAPDQPSKEFTSTDVSPVPLVVRPKQETLYRREAEMFLDGLARAYLEHARLLVDGDVPDLQLPDVHAPAALQDE